MLQKERSAANTESYARHNRGDDISRITVTLGFKKLQVREIGRFTDQFEAALDDLSDAD